MQHWRILLMIDYPTMGLIVKKLLLELGYSNVVDLNSGDELLPELRSSQADVLILDWELPQGGLSVLKQVRADFKLARLPVLMLLADGRREHLVEAIQAGVSAYLVKPFAAHALQQQLLRIQQSFTRAGR
jgi:two-component system chemotaxis response regulator CheY